MSERLINPTAPVLITLQARQWNLVLNLMNEGLGVMAGTFAELQRQYMSQQEPPQMPQHLRSVPDKEAG